MKYIYPLIVAVAALTLSGCAQKEVRIILLPEDGGKVGRIELTDKSGKSYTVDKAWEQVELSKDGKAKSEITSEQAVMAQFGQTLSALPIPPATFMIFFKIFGGKCFDRGQPEQGVGVLCVAAQNLFVLPLRIVQSPGLKRLVGAFQRRVVSGLAAAQANACICIAGFPLRQGGGCRSSRSGGGGAPHGGNS